MEMWFEFILLLTGAYVLGSIPAAYLCVKWATGADIRKIGTGNVGSSNVAQTTSKPLAVAVGLFDMGKGTLAFFAAYWLGMEVWQQMAAGLVTVAGHNWSVFIRFHGGKGMITTLGVIFAISPLLGLIILLTAYLPAFFKQMALGVFVCFLTLPLWSWFAWDWFASSRLGIEDKATVTIGLFIIALMGAVKRLIGARVTISRDVPIGELLLNRLLFDRDIRDRYAWINRSSSG
ncbi:MAG: glycerol-3-phosphate acyltransferase [Dehalococcoidia bacterium]|jgi:glycerol-3-phosphate acyltransferase PlsY|nr:glycerol-3-phosphate acyltransferase [Dehalococcoidia bacterium]